VFHQDIQTPRSGLKKQGAAKFLLTDFSVFGYMTKHSFEFLVWLLKPFIILDKIQSKESFENFMLNKLRSSIQTNVTEVIAFVFS